MKGLLIVLVFLLVSSSSTPGTISRAPLEESLSRAPWPTNVWSTATPEDQGMNSSDLNSMMDYFSNKDIQIDGLVVVRNGWIVFEEYPSDLGQEDTHHIFSCTKSVTATLIGIASQQETLLSIDDNMLDFFNNYNISNPGEDKNSITIRNLLEMTAGLSWDEEQYGDKLNDYNKMIRTDDWIQYVLNKPMASTPGETFVYNSGISHLLSGL